MGVSPTALKKVKRAVSKGALRSNTLNDATPPAPGERNYFLERVVSSITPAVLKVCSIPEFRNSNKDPEGVARLVLRRIAGHKGRKMAGKIRIGTKRKVKKRLDFDNDAISPDLDSLLKEMASSWKVAMRNHDRNSAARILQITLQAIPCRHGVCSGCMYASTVCNLSHTLAGRVSDWLGPDYFDDEVDVVSGCPVRVLKITDKAKFRNSYEHTCLGMCRHAYTHAHIHTYTHKYIYMHAYMHTHTFIHTVTHAHNTTSHTTTHSHTPPHTLPRHTLQCKGL